MIAGNLALVPTGVTVCEACGEPLDRSDPTLVRAGIRVDIGEKVPRLLDGPDSLFHDRCFPRNSQVWYPRH